MFIHESSEPNIYYFVLLHLGLQKQTRRYALWVIYNEDELV